MAERETVEERLAKKADVYCLPYEIEVIIPDMCVEHCPQSLEIIRNTMHELFGGTTVIKGVGSWHDDAHNVDVVESVSIVRASHSCTDPGTLEKLEKKVAEAGKLSGQLSVAIKAGKLYLLPPNSLVARE